MSKVKTENLKELAELYNSNGKETVYALLKTKYNIKYPYSVFKRMCEHPELSYDKEKDYFKFNTKQNTENVFMSMEELCSPIIPQHIKSKEEHQIDSRPAAMGKLIQELIGDRLLELSKYVTIDSISKRIIVDKTTLIQDGYQMITH